MFPTINDNNMPVLSQRLASSNKRHRIQYKTKTPSSVNDLICSSDDMFMKDNIKHIQTLLAFYESLA